MSVHDNQAGGGLPVVIEYPRREDGVNYTPLAVPCARCALRLTEFNYSPDKEGEIKIPVCERNNSGSGECTSCQQLGGPCVQIPPAYRGSVLHLRLCVDRHRAESPDSLSGELERLKGEARKAALESQRREEQLSSWRRKREERQAIQSRGRGGGEALQRAPKRPIDVIESPLGVTDEGDEVAIRRLAVAERQASALEEIASTLRAIRAEFAASRRAIGQVATAISGLSGVIGHPQDQLEDTTAQETENGH
ncbi:hypothetical protein SODALDRAFT_378344 [Sodiomyces alkalinus F11]|uniref:Uncharacterized protein n=1 Tax=Sodiomyces alkalinus (strain CBS 110278 / VKM F-3762 / F11) TaxID=1314773 RepID=A0A3N2PXI1_SODAK|nr:hypothetical protein SODALDRAFT_378344 [Sodiomyces alkalinus F11]ROT39243.1 hypothetical protein SODALDRAFT_378344 [Sodiomyces alkalinus F11]